MYNIFQLNKISPIGTDIFDKQSYNMVEDMANADGVLVRSAAMHDMELPPQLKAIARAGAGVNNIPLDKCTNEGVVVFNTPGANANGVKEITMLALLMSSRKIAPAIDWAKTLKGEGDKVPALVEKGKSSFAGPEIMGKKLGILGLGAIGIMVANMAIAMGMEVYGYDPYISVEGAWQLSREVKYAATLAEIYKECDYISLHLPLLPATKGMIDNEAIALMKPGVRIINIARGELVDDDAIIEATKSGKVHTYVTDFPNEKMLDKEGILAIPHLGASTPESEDNCAVMAVRQMMDFLENGNVKNSVNYPDNASPRTTAWRICVMHKNIPAMISSITNAISSASLNIETLSNKSKKDVAYTILDVDTAVPDSVADSLNSIEGVIKVNIYR